MLRRIISSTVKPRYAMRHFYDKYFLDTAAIKKLENIYKNKTVFVVGNGPSLNKTPLDQISDYPSIGMNKIDMLFDKTTWRPSSIVCVNSLVARQHRDVFCASPIPIFLPTKSRRMLGNKILDNGGFFSTLPIRDFSTDICIGAGRADTVTYTALQFAYYMGAKRVVLLGVDHSYGTKQKDANKYVKKSGDDEDHFDPNYFAHGQFWGIPDLEKSELIYELAKKAFESDDREILDATVGGKLDVFPKITLQEALDYESNGA